MTGSGGLAHRGQEAGEGTWTCGASSTASRASTGIAWHWVKGHAGHRRTSGADALANRGVESLG